MKVGKHPKCFGGPSAAFLERKTAQAPTSPSSIPKDGPLRVFLDDERPAPDGWVLVKTPEALYQLLKDESDRIECLALDWHLGGGFDDGEAVATKIAETIHDHPTFLPSLTLVTAHSTRIEKSVAMMRTIESACDNSRDPSLPEVQCKACHVDETATLAKYLA